MVSKLNVILVIFVPLIMGQDIMAVIKGMCEHKDRIPEATIKEIDAMLSCQANALPPAVKECFGETYGTSYPVTLDEATTAYCGSHPEDNYKMYLECSRTAGLRMSVEDSSRMTKQILKCSTVGHPELS